MKCNSCDNSQYRNSPFYHFKELLDANMEIKLQEFLLHPCHLLQTLAFFCQGEHCILQKEVNDDGLWPSTEAK